MFDVVETAKSLKPAIMANRDVTETSRRLAPKIVDALKSSGLCRMGLPKELGGLNDNPVLALKVYEELASAEASVAWVVWNNHLACTFGRFLSDAVRQEIFGNQQHLFANSTRPEGVARVVDGGYSVTGKWTLVSGCELSDWFALRCIVQEGEETPALGPGTKLRLLFLPRSEVSIVDTWHVGGLRGTGSHDITISDTFVPAERSVSFDEPDQVCNAYSALPIGCMNAAGCGAMALGVAQAATDALIEVGQSRVTPGKSPDLRDRQRVQSSVAESLISLQAARDCLHHCVEKLWKQVSVQEPISDDLLAGIWSSAVHATTTARASMTDTYAVAGTISLYSATPIERAHRDLHALLQHGIIQPHWMTQAGMVSLGLAPNASMFRI